MTEGLLDITEASAYLKIPIWTLRKWHSQGKGPAAARIGRHLRYRPEELRRFVREREATRAGS